MIQHVIVADLGFGDAGKGATVDRLCSLQPVHTVVRYNGGCQAGHTVVRPNGYNFPFSQLGAGSFQGAQTMLSRFMMVEPYALWIEATAFSQLQGSSTGDVLTSVSVEDTALVTTPYHWLVNRDRETRRGDQRHGSCGRGIGETARYAEYYPEYALTVADILNPAKHKAKLQVLRDWAEAEAPQVDMPPPSEVMDRQRWVIDHVNVVSDDYLPTLLHHHSVVFEGAQGVLLDQNFGFHPHTTWSTTTMANAETLLAEAGVGAQRLGVLRTYAVRHGAGPLPTEHPYNLPESHNVTDPWQGPFRQGHFDAPLMRYALAVNGHLDGLVLTHLDRAREVQMVRAYESFMGDDPFEPASWFTDIAQLDQQLQENLGKVLAFTDCVATPVENWVDAVQEELHVPVVMTSHGPKTHNFRRL